MKTKINIAALVTIGGLSLLLSAHSQTWDTVDAIVYPAAGPSAQVDDIAAAPDGTLYAIGASLSAAGGFDANVVRRSSDGGNTWQSVASFSPVTGNGINKIAVDGAGRLYAAGLFNGTWTVLRSLDQGANWTTPDTFNTGANSYPELRDITSDAGGNLYVAGSATPSRGPRQWLVRKGVPSPTGGVSWSTVDAYAVDRTYGASATVIATKPSSTAGQPAEIYVGGAAQSSSGANWLVRRSVDGGATWTVVDSLASGLGGVQTLVIGADGSLFTSGNIRTVTGTKKNPLQINSFVIRKGVASSSAPNGMVWSTQQILPQSGSATEFRPQCSTVDASGRLFFAGYDVAANVWNWRVQVSVDGGQTSTDSDSFVGVAFCLSADAAGNVFAGGYFGSELPNAGGKIRRLAAQAAP